MSPFKRPAGLAVLPTALRDRLYAAFTEGLRTKGRAALEAASRGDPTAAEDARRYGRVLDQLPGRGPRQDALDWELAVAGLLFRQGLYFACHEFLETPWRRERGETKLRLQALIQAAAGFYKVSAGSRRGAVELLSNAARKIPASGGPVRLSAFRKGLLAAVASLSAGRLPPRAPRWGLAAADLRYCPRSTARGGSR